MMLLRFLSANQGWVCSRQHLAYARMGTHARGPVPVRGAGLPHRTLVRYASVFNMSSRNPHVSPSVLYSAQAPKVCRVNHIKVVLSEFSDIFEENFSNLKHKHSVVHEIETTAGPFTCRPLRLAPEKMETVKQEFLEIEKQGIMRCSSRTWGSPLLVVEKKGEGLRPCGDFRVLNSVTKKDRYNLPLLQDFAQNLARMKCFSKLDLCKAYYQVPLSPSAI